jgi:2-phosphosulfolactate phosphatase
VFYEQREFDIRCEWGQHGAAVLAPISEAVIIVDVLSFSTSVDIAVQRGAVVFPYHGKRETAAEFAASVQAELADWNRSTGRPSLSPRSLMEIQAGARLVLPSLNGSRLALAASQVPVLAGCLRNARAVALTAMKYGSKIAVIPAGERWQDDGSLRPSLEDLIGAGAIIRYLSGVRSPEAEAAAAAFSAAGSVLAGQLQRCSSGKELIERGFEEDVRLAAQLNASDSAPILVNGAFIRAPG